jgi:hypothetical protein
MQVEGVGAPEQPLRPITLDDLESVNDPIVSTASEQPLARKRIPTLPTSNNTNTDDTVVQINYAQNMAPAKTQWRGEQGETLRELLQDWADDANTTLIWSSEYDYPLQTDITVNGSFKNAVETVLAGLSQAKPRPMGRLHTNSASGQPVLVIETENLTN